MATKQFRPKANAGENLSLDIMMPNTATGGDRLTIRTWPYEPKSPEEEAALSAHPLLTDQPPTEAMKSQGSGQGSGQGSKGGDS